MTKRVNNDAQTSIRMSEDLKNRIEKSASESGLATTDWIRRACEEKLERAENPTELRLHKLEIEVDKLKKFIELTKDK